MNSFQSENHDSTQLRDRKIIFATCHCKCNVMPKPADSTSPSFSLKNKTPARGKPTTRLLQYISLVPWLSILP